MLNGVFGEGERGGQGGNGDASKLTTVFERLSEVAFPAPGDLGNSSNEKMTEIMPPVIKDTSITRKFPYCSVEKRHCLIFSYLMLYYIFFH